MRNRDRAMAHARDLIFSDHRAPRRAERAIERVVRHVGEEGIGVVRSRAPSNEHRPRVVVLRDSLPKERADAALTQRCGNKAQPPDSWCETPHRSPPLLLRSIGNSRAAEGLLKQRVP